jgi:hypothetical protein
VYGDTYVLGHPRAAAPALALSLTGAVAPFGAFAASGTEADSASRLQRSLAAITPRRRSHHVLGRLLIDPFETSTCLIGPVDAGASSHDGEYMAVAVSAGREHVSVHVFEAGVAMVPASGVPFVLALAEVDAVRMLLPQGESVCLMWGFVFGWVGAHGSRSGVDVCRAACQGRQHVAAAAHADRVCPDRRDTVPDSRL